VCARTQTKRIMRIFLSNLAAHQPHFAHADAEVTDDLPEQRHPQPPSWTLRIEGRLLEVNVRAGATSAPDDVGSHGAHLGGPHIGVAAGGNAAQVFVVCAVARDRLSRARARAAAQPGPRRGVLLTRRPVLDGGRGAHA
jgi:hypothetical protein